METMFRVFLVAVTIAVISVIGMIVLGVCALVSTSDATDQMHTTTSTSVSRPRSRYQEGTSDGTGDMTPSEEGSVELSSDTVDPTASSSGSKPDIPTPNNRGQEDKSSPPENHKWTNPVTGTVTSDKGSQGPRRQHEAQMILKFRSFEPSGYRQIQGSNKNVDNTDRVNDLVPLPYGYGRLKELLLDGLWFDYFRYDLINNTGYLASQIETPTDTALMRDLSVVFMTHVANLRTFMNIGSILSANDAVDELRDKIGRSGRVKRAVENYNALARIPMWNIWRNQAVKQSGVFSDETDGPLLITIFTVPHGDANGAVLHYDPPVSVQDYISSGGGGASMTKDRGGDFQTDNDELFDVIIAEASYAVQWLNARASGQDDSHQSDLRKLRVFTEGLRIPTGLPDFREGVTIDPTHFYERLVNGALMYKVTTPLMTSSRIHSSWTLRLFSSGHLTGISNATTSGGLVRERYSWFSRVTPISIHTRPTTTVQSFLQALRGRGMSPRVRRKSGPIGLCGTNSHVAGRTRTSTHR